MADNDIGTILKNHVENIKALRFPDYATAETLYQRSKMLAAKFFPGKHYNVDLISIRFKSISTFIESEHETWSQGINELYSIAKAMYDDHCITPIKNKPTIQYIQVENTEKLNQIASELEELKRIHNSYKIKIDRRNSYLVFGVLLLISSIALWTFNYIVRWQWLEIHTKKIAIYITVQLLILLLLSRLVIKSKFVDIATIAAFIIALISLI